MQPGGVRDRSLPKTRECVWPFPQGPFMPPSKHAPGFFGNQKTCFCGEKPRERVSPFPQGLFMPPKTRPRVCTQLKTVFLNRKPKECVSPFPQAPLMPPKTSLKAFSAAKMPFWIRKRTLIAPIPTHVGICVSPFP